MKRSLLIILIILLVLSLQFMAGLNLGLIALPGSNIPMEGPDSGAVGDVTTLEKVVSWSAELFSGGSVENRSTLVEDKALEIVSGLENDYDMMVAVYDWITQNMAYDLDKADNVSAYGSGAEYLMLNGRGVCHDYAKLAEAMLKAVGIEAAYVSGEVINSAGEAELHAWNTALVNGQVYAMDTTWGAGFPSTDRSEFIQKPRPIYLASPSELERLHQDPLYRQEKEHAYMLETAACAEIYYLPGYEAELLELFNEYRFERELSRLEPEVALIDLVRQSAADSTEAICNGEEFTLDALSEQLKQDAPSIGMKSASIHSLSIWSYQLPGAEEIYERFIDDQSGGPLNEGHFQKAAVSVLRRGDLLVSIFVFLEYH